MNKRFNVEKAWEECRDDCAERDRQSAAQRLVTARRMVIGMAGRSHFTVRTFLAAATLGNPDAFPDQQQTLSTARHLQGGSVIGLRNVQKQLDVVGVMSAGSFRMHVEDGYQHSEDRDLLAPLSQSNRSLEASLFLSQSTTRPRLEDYEGSLRYVLLVAEGEADPTETDPEVVFTKPRSIVVGRREFMDHRPIDDIDEHLVSEALRLQARMDELAAGDRLLDMVDQHGVLN